MKPLAFKESNKNLLPPSGMSNCDGLPVYTDGSQCISCWKMTFLQRISALVFGRVWVSVLSGQTQPPIWLSCEKTVFKEGQA